jgi:hypothetical protein
MGATESIFYEDEPSALSFDQSSASTPDRNRPRGDLVPQQHVSVDGARVARRPKRRSRAGTDSNLPPKILNGLVLGRPSSGKRTLLERLKGKDPFLNQDGWNISTVDQSEEEVSSALVPYQAPSGSPLWDRLQIKVRLSNEVLLESRIDFVVVMIHPRHDFNQLQSYLQQLISGLVKYFELSQRNQIDGVGQIGKSALSLCFLLNFRDLEQKPQDQGIQEAEVKQCVLGILQQYSDRLPNKEQLLLEFSTTSLFNCYGLSALHHFIYRSYLRLKQNELEQMLIEVGLQSTKHQETPRVEYKEFLKILESSKAVESKKSRPSQPQGEVQSVVGRPNPADTIPTREALLKTQTSSQQERLESRKDPNQTKRHIIANRAIEPLKPTVTSPPTYQSAQDALEAFLASDDEEEESYTPNPKGKARSGYISSDDDDDFFYNEAGERCRIQANIDVSSSCSEEEAHVSIKEKTHKTESKSSARTPMVKETARGSLQAPQGESCSKAALPPQADKSRPASREAQNDSGSKNTTSINPRLSDSKGHVENNDPLQTDQQEPGSEIVENDGDNPNNAIHEKGLSRSQASGNVSEKEPAADALDGNNPGEAPPFKHGKIQIKSSLDSEGAPFLPDDSSGDHTLSENHETGGTSNAPDRAIPPAPADSRKNAQTPSPESKEKLTQVVRDDSNDNSDHKIEEAHGTQIQSDESSQEKAADSATNTGSTRNHQDGHADDSDDDGYFFGAEETKGQHGVADDSSDEDEFFVDGTEGASPPSVEANREQALSASTAKRSSPSESPPANQQKIIDDMKDAETSCDEQDGDPATRSGKSSGPNPILSDQKLDTPQKADHVLPTQAPEEEISPGLSAAAQAAIAAAQREAELMLQQSLDVQDIASSSQAREVLKKAKKKESKERKKKKEKKKKEKKAKRTVDD